MHHSHGHPTCGRVGYCGKAWSHAPRQFIPEKLWVIYVNITVVQITNVDEHVKLALGKFLTGRHIQPSEHAAGNSDAQTFLHGFPGHHTSHLCRHALPKLGQAILVLNTHTPPPKRDLNQASRHPSRPWPPLRRPPLVRSYPFPCPKACPCPCLGRWPS